MRCTVWWSVPLSGAPGGGAYGEPQLTGAGALDLSIAHAHERVVVAVARGCAVGVDVERIGPFEDLAVAAAGMLDCEERAVLSALRPSERAGAFFATGPARRRC